MREEEQLLEAINATLAAKKRFALATVVRVKGSAYRREGTKMLIDEVGQQVCMISGGCLEQEVGELAQAVIASGDAEVHPFDLDEDVVWGLGLGCGGAVDVLIEAFDEGPAFSAWLEAVKEQGAAVLATMIHTDGSHQLSQQGRLFVAQDGTTKGSLHDEQLEKQVLDFATQKMQALYPRSETYRFTTAAGQALDIFIDVNSPPAELAIFGAGHDALPLASMARDLGYRLTVIDARHAFVNEERFPGAKLIRSHPSGFAEQVSLSARSYAIIMNHHLERDKACLRFVAQSPAPYIGILGPRSRYERMLSELKDEGFYLNQQQHQRIRNPIGVDIGADSASEIAVSIMAELLAVRGGFKAGFLQQRSGRIHQPS
jgi:xanthine/CO dehydrogenase XdhC/CoxF family maturation factor